jgi:hypothetical protein
LTWREGVARSGRQALFALSPRRAFGDRDAEVLLVGAAPAATGTNRAGRMFTGVSPVTSSTRRYIQHRLRGNVSDRRPATRDRQALTGIQIVAAVGARQLPRYAEWARRLALTLYAFGSILAVAGAAPTNL